MIDKVKEKAHLPSMNEKESDDAHLEFLRDEGLEVLALFRKIRDKEKRLLILDLMRAIIEVQKPANGGISSAKH